MTRPSRSPDKKSSAGQSSRKAAENMKQKAAMKKTKATLSIKQETAKKKNKEISGRGKLSSFTKHIALAIKHVRTEALRCRRDDVAAVAAGLAKLSWIVINNVHAKLAAFEDIITVLFENFQLRSHAFQCDPEGKFRGVIDVAFETREDAEGAVDLYHNNIKLFGRTWKLHLIDKRRYTRSLSDAALSSLTKRVYSRPLMSIFKLSSPADKSSPRTLFTAVRNLSLQDSAVETGVSAKVCISNISSNIPSNIIPVLFEKAGTLRILDHSLDPAHHIPGTAMVVYTRREDAVAAVKHFANNICFFGYTWTIELDNSEPSQPLAINSPSTSSRKKNQSRLGR